MSTVPHHSEEGLHPGNGSISLWCLVMCAGEICFECTYRIWLQRLQVHFKVYVRVVQLLQTFTPKITAGTLSC